MTASIKKKFNLENPQLEIEERIRETEKRREDAARKFESLVEKRTKDKEAKRAKEMQERELQFEKMETIVLNTFCDYSRSMRSLPRDERLSVIISKDNKESNVYVFRQSELDSCDSGKTEIRKNAVSYVF